MTAHLVTQEMLEQDLFTSGEPVLVDFFTTWCGPCKAMAPALDEVAKELEGAVKVVKLDCDQNPDVREKYGVRGVPTLVLFKNGEQTARHVGALVQRATLRKWVDASVAEPKQAAADPRAIGFKLSNGMDVVVIPDNREPLVTQQVWYRVGAADGAPGVANFLEHLSFKSTSKTRPSSPRAPAEFVAKDATGYNQRVVKEDLKLAMELEADRMVRLHLTDDDVKLVRRRIAEMREALSKYAEHEFYEQMMASIYVCHPYRIPAAGWGHEIETLSLEDAVSFQKRHYAPNNAVLVLAGDVTPEEAKNLAEEVYGKIPASPEALRGRRPAEPAAVGARRVTVKDPRISTASFSRYYIVPSYATAKSGEAETLEVLLKSLSLSRSVRKHPAGAGSTQVAGSYHGLRTDSGLIELHCSVSHGDLAAAEADVDAVVEDWRRNGVGEVELERAKKSLLADFRDGADDRVLAQRYGCAISLGGTIEKVEAWPTAISKVTSDDIKKVVKEYLDERRSVTGWLLPEADTGATAQPFERDTEVA